MFVNVLVTGAAGFIGSNYLRQIIGEDNNRFSRIFALDNLTYAGRVENLSDLRKHKNFQFIEGDICNFDLISSIVSEVDAVINFAAESHVDRSLNGFAKFLQTNAFGVQTLLESIRLSRKDVRFLQVSTDEVYGSILNGSWDESSLLLPNSPYAASKASGEMIARAYKETYKLDIVVTRCSNNYGPFQFPEKFIPLIITNLISGKKVPIYGDGRNIREWIHVSDHCRAITNVLLTGKSGEIYNVGSGVELTNLELVHRILDIMKKDVSWISYVEDRIGHDFRYSVNFSKIERNLGYTPLIEFSIGLEDTVNWYIDNHSWWQELI